MILPWSHDDPARAYDHVVRLVWGFWQGMERCPNGVPYYLQHQVWKPEHDPRGLGGDQLSMALSSWSLLHGYLGDPGVVANMRTIADHWLANGMTGGTAPGRTCRSRTTRRSTPAATTATWWRARASSSRTRRGLRAELVDLHKITDDPRYLEQRSGSPTRSRAT